jgi:hypothetical protein
LCGYSKIQKQLATLFEVILINKEKILIKYKTRVVLVGLEAFQWQKRLVVGLDVVAKLDKRFDGHERWQTLVVPA